MIPLYEKPPEKITFEGKRYKLDLSFGKVLRYFDLVSDNKGLTRTDIAEIALGWFLPGAKLAGMDTERKLRLISAIHKEYIAEPQRRILGKQSEQTVDFRYDSGYIYAAFMQTYGIDLYECAEKLPWCKFMALFRALPDNTAMSQIMSIRGRKMPVPNNSNREEIQHLSELKLLYAIPREDSGQSTRASLNDLFEMLLKKAMR